MTTSLWRRASEEEFHPTMKWIYGIKIDDIREPMH